MRLEQILIVDDTDLLGGRQFEKEKLSLSDFKTHVNLVSRHYPFVEYIGKMGKINLKSRW